MFSFHTNDFVPELAKEPIGCPRAGEYKLLGGYIINTVLQLALQQYHIIDKYISILVTDATDQCKNHKC